MSIGCNPEYRSLAKRLATVSHALWAAHEQQIAGVVIDQSIGDGQQGGRSRKPIGKIAQVRSGGAEDLLHLAPGDELHGRRVVFRGVKKQQTAAVVPRLRRERWV